jgi:hypothetical protein
MLSYGVQMTQRLPIHDSIFLFTSTLSSGCRLLTDPGKTFRLHASERRDEIALTTLLLDLQAAATRLSSLDIPTFLQLMLSFALQSLASVSSTEQRDSQSNTARSPHPIDNSVSKAAGNVFKFRLRG